jgi:RNA polymerase sigma-70 factor (ECF subfamily)
VAHLSDAALVLRVARFDEEAFAELYRRHAPAVYGLAKSVLRNGSQAEDVTQEIFLELWRFPEKFDPDRGALRSYLVMRAHSRAIDVLRSEQSRRVREAKVGSNVDVTFSVEAAAVEVVSAEGVRMALEALPESERTMVVLAYYLGLSYREVARAVGEPEGTVKSKIRRALQRMKDFLANPSELPLGQEEREGTSSGED